MIHDSSIVFIFFKHPDGEDGLIATTLAASTPEGGGPEDNGTTLFPTGEFDQSNGSGMLPPEEEEPTQETTIGDVEEAQPTREEDPHSKTLEPVGSDIIPDSKTNTDRPGHEMMMKQENTLGQL